MSVCVHLMGAQVKGATSQICTFVLWGTRPKCAALNLSNLVLCARYETQLHKRKEHVVTRLTSKPLLHPLHQLLVCFCMCRRKRRAKLALRRKRSLNLTSPSLRRRCVCVCVFVCLDEHGYICVPLVESSLSWSGLSWVVVGYTHHLVAPYIPFTRLLFTYIHLVPRSVSCFEFMAHGHVVYVRRIYPFLLNVPLAHPFFCSSLSNKASEWWAAGTLNKSQEFLLLHIPWCTSQVSVPSLQLCRVGQNRTSAPYMTV